MDNWTKEEFAEFDRITRQAATYGMDHAGKRPIACAELKTFVAKHGEAKCDAMFNVLKQFDRGDYE